ncbi:hypothetical protein BIV57_00115 [Mangrovactinospora gilvigrisea]|uniref:CN hydrolase domain-containing protein n=1 Tax=Mangrovactinospora gilvigrisea TaxID=1428644 RepID=A0A1J7BKT9_9ACTN|nr:nitrilase-related carbon-nitrogen hydrolase [Mangrovactinospora gilvigrisea]OIV39295.1 hypothetical protein BIV57_00115 [Mangrovactinospora gilvigrisea]
MRPLSLALLQLAPAQADLEANLAAGEDACRRARALGADLALFPELWSNGYASAVPDGLHEDLFRHPQRWEGVDRLPPVPGPEQVWRGQPVGQDSPFVQHFCALAEQLEMAIALTYLEAWDGPPRNTLALIDRRGRIVLHQAKVHTCAFGLPEALLTPGEEFGTATLDTAVGEVRVGAMICYDREFPESARALMLGGAELILVPNACDMEINRLAQLRARAFENMTAVAMANYPGPGFGHSVVFDGMAFGDAGSRDMRLVEAGEQPGIVVAELDLAALRDYRRRETWGNAFRRPTAYRALTEDRIEPPFVRRDQDGRPSPAAPRTPVAAQACTDARPTHPHSVVQRYLDEITPQIVEVVTFEQGGTNVLRLRDREGAFSVLKWYPVQQRSLAELQGAADRARRLRELGWPLPRILAVEEFGGLVLAREEFLDGEHPSQITEAALHTMLDLSRAGRGAATERATGWLRSFADDLHTGGRKVEPPVLTRHRYAASVLARARAAFETLPAEPRAFDDLIHGDFSPGNVLVQDGRLLGVVDWEGVTAGGAALDLVTLEWDLELWGRSVRHALPSVRAELDRLAPAPLRDAYRLYQTCRNLSWALGTPEEADVVRTAQRITGALS